MLIVMSLTILSVVFFLVSGRGGTERIGFN